MKLLQIEQKWNPLFIYIGFFLIFLLGALDYITGYQLAFSLFYLFPIAVLAWKGGRWLGLVGALACTVVWFAANSAAGKAFPSLFVMYWNTSVRFLNLALFSLLTSFLMETIARLDTLSRTDPLTGVANSRAFLELLERETERARRYQRPMTLAYFDLDNFKSINDALGHAVGDKVLQTVVSTITTHIRMTDTLGRLGGDEFALLLPETDIQEARTVIDKIRAGIKQEMASREWAVTLSIGSQTLLDSHFDKPEELIKRADDLMYEAKSTGKDKAILRAR
jgi:diguanylate cyclase (GGDEF)-like protein